jgi:hypothetical protein
VLDERAKKGELKKRIRKKRLAVDIKEGFKEISRERKRRRRYIAETRVVENKFWKHRSYCKILRFFLNRIYIPARTVRIRIYNKNFELTKTKNPTDIAIWTNFFDPDVKQYLIQ